MRINAEHTSVLIVGAGPSGLMMAAQLLRYGIQPVIIDCKQGPTTHSKALAVQARSLEIYRQMGIVDKILAEGKRGKGIAFYNSGQEGAKLRLDDVGQVDTPYPYVLMYPQSRNERQLLDFLTQNCCPVYWNTELTSLTQNESGVEVTLQSDGLSQKLTCDWVVGADGAHSPVRKALNIPFTGDTYKHLFYLIDGKINKEFDEDLIRVFLSKAGMAGFFPMPDEGYYRIIGSLPENYPESSGQNLQKILIELRRVTGMEINIDDCRWLITYKLHHRMAGDFRSDRCFLIGDAAHIHSPVGGQGMNTGLQDAYNLAWKLAYVIGDKASAKLLNSYAEERMPVAKRLLKTTDNAFNVVMSRSVFAGIYKKYLMQPLLRFMWKREKIRNAFFKILSQTGISYRGSSINLHLSNADTCKAGDRLPCLKVFDEKRQQHTDLHEWCTKPGFTLIAMAKLSEMNVFVIARWITQHYQGILNFYYLPPSRANEHIYSAFQISPGGQKAIVVRPDLHIGFVNDWVDTEKIDNYLRNVVGLSYSSPQPDQA